MCFHWVIKTFLYKTVELSNMATPQRLDTEARGVEMKSRLEKCWRHDINWELYPKELRKVCMYILLDRRKQLHSFGFLMKTCDRELNNLVNLLICLQVLC